MKPSPAAKRGAHRIDRLLSRGFRAIFRGGWAARLTYPLGLEGRVRVERHLFAVRRAVHRTSPLRIAFASDFHAGGTTHPALLEAACVALADARPDVVLLGGDFVAFDAEDVDQLLPLLRGIRAPLGKYAVLGNHDLVTESRRIVTALESAGVALLTNRNVRLPVPHDDVWLCGLDDPTVGEPDAEAAFDAADGVRLVLMHSPDGLLEIGRRRFDVAFCGHTHGGQIALPGGAPLVVPRGRLSRRYARGTFAVGADSRMLVSRGVGCTSVPLRIFSGPQVHACLVVARAAAAAAA